MRSRSLLVPLSGLLLSCLPCLAPRAASLPAPAGEVVLTVRGDIAHPNVGDEAQFDRAMLRALPSRVIETRTPWHSDVGRYAGPLAKAVLEAAGARGERVRVRALNAFEAMIPVSDFERHDVILAMTRNGEPMPIRDLGPLFVLYPFDENPELLNEVIRFRSVWQVTCIFVY